MFAAEWGTGQVFWSMLWFSLFFTWIWLVFAILGDVFRSPDLSGGAKAAWAVVVILFPFVGVFGYLVLRGRFMSQHSLDEARLRSW
jgi:hypothetical protein